MTQRESDIQRFILDHIVRSSGFCIAVLICFGVIGRLPGYIAASYIEISHFLE